MAKGYQAFKALGLVVNKLLGSGSAPTAVAGTGAGTGPTITVTGNNVTGTIALTTGTGCAGSNAIIATLTFNSAYDAAPYPSLHSASAATVALAVGARPFVDQAATTASVFVVKSGATALADSTSYLFTYHVLG